MPNPKAPRIYRSAAETQSDLDAFTERLRRLGATDEDLVLVRENWDTFDDDWTPERRRQMLRLSDDELAHAVVETHDEWAETHPDPARDEAVADAVRLQLISDAHDRLGLAVSKILDWVGADLDRAQIVADLERQTAEPRKTLIAPLEAILGPVS